MKRSKFWAFNISEEEYEKILDFQDRGCAICKSNSSGKLYVDHDHSTGLVRGGLCFRCNIKLGDLTIERAEKFLAYLLNPPATQALGAPRFGLVGRVGTKKQRKLYNKLQKSQKKAQNEKTDPVSSTDPEPVTIG